MEYIKITVHYILTEKTKMNEKKKPKEVCVWDPLTRSAEEDRIDRELMQGHEPHLY